MGSGVGQVLGKGAMLGSKFIGDAVRGAVGSALTQGIGVAKGFQQKFDWAHVALAGIGSAAGDAFARTVLNVDPSNFSKNATGYTLQAATWVAVAIANAATRSLADGSDFEDNLLAALLDVIGSTLGNMIADPVVSKIEARRHEVDRARETLRVPVEEGGGDPNSVTRTDTCIFLDELKAYNEQNERIGQQSSAAIGSPMQDRHWTGTHNRTTRVRQS